jgi:lactate permease
MLFLSLLYFRKGKLDIDLTAWLPYLLLVALLLLPKLLIELNNLLTWEIKWKSIFNTHISAAMQPLKSPLVPFLIVAVLFNKKKQNYKTGVKTAVEKLFSVALLLFPIIAVAQLMLHSGVIRPSMISHVAEAFSHTGKTYIALTPFIGITGAFITGSTTLSNIVFGASHMHTAELLSLNPAVVYAGQLAGASIGNAVCLFNIIAACSVASIKEPNKVLLKNLLPCILAGVIMGLMCYLIVHFNW